MTGLEFNKKYTKQNYKFLTLKLKNYHFQYKLGYNKDIYKLNENNGAELEQYLKNRNS